MPLITTNSGIQRIKPSTLRLFDAIHGRDEFTSLDAAKLGVGGLTISRRLYELRVLGLIEPIGFKDGYRVFRPVEVTT